MATEAFRPPRQEHLQWDAVQPLLWAVEYEESHQKAKDILF